MTDCNALHVQDIGEYTPNTSTIFGTRLNSQEADILHDIRDKIGAGQVNSSAISFSPPWIVEKALQSEMDDKWSEAFVEVAEAKLPGDANVISSDVVLKIKTKDDESLKIKAQIVVHGNRDTAREKVGSDCAAADMDVIRMVLCMAACLGFNVDSADIKEAFMQSGPIQRSVFVGPPRDCHRKRGMVWKLLKLTYLMADAGRQWLLRAEHWLLNDGGLERVPGVSQVFIRREVERISLVMAKVIDDFLIAGKRIT